MLKFQDNNTTVSDNFEDFILIIYVIIDDLYKKYTPHEISERHRILDAKLSDSEIITISICGELIGIDSENAWFSFIKKNYCHLFPNMCSRSRFNRTRRALLQVTELLRQKIVTFFNMNLGHCFIADSFPLPVCKFGRARYCRNFKEYGANYGKCPSKKETYFGYKVHAIITIEGFITEFEITPASIDDREGLRDLITDKSNIIIFGDKGYAGENFMQELKAQNISLMSLKRSNCQNNWSKPTRQTIFRLRRRIETVFSQLSQQLNAQRVLAESFQGLCTRLVNKILAHNLCMALNFIFHNTYDIGKIKQLVF